MKAKVNRPGTLGEVAAQSDSLEDFGLLLREFNQTLRRGDVSNRPALAGAIREVPTCLRSRFDGGDIADAYLAAYADWIAQKAGIDQPEWTADPNRSLERPWFADDARASLLVLAPAAFRQRGVFTIPEDVVRLRRGRPKVSLEVKKKKARKRDRRYRERLRKWVELGRAQTGD